MNVKLRQLKINQGYELYSDNIFHCQFIIRSIRITTRQESYTPKNTYLLRVQILKYAKSSRTTFGSIIGLHIPPDYVHRREFSELPITPKQMNNLNLLYKFLRG